MMAVHTFTANADGSCYGGQHRRPAWIRNQASGTWGIVPLVQKWSDVDPAKDPLVNPNFPGSAPWRGIVGFTARATAWAAYTAYGGVIYDPPSGGHGDYAGNERFMCDLNLENPTVIRTANPSGGIGNEIILDDGVEAERTGLYADGQPRSAHNYNAAVYFPPTHKYLLAILGTGLFSTGQNGTASAAVFNAANGAFEGLTSPSPAGSGIRSPMGSCYDENRQLIWYRGAGTAYFTTFNPITDQWVIRGAQTAITGQLGFCYIPEHDVIFLVNSFYGNKFAIFDCTTYQYYQPPISGSFSGMTLNGGCQPHYMGNGKIAVWNNSTNTTQINTLEFSGNPRNSTFNVSQLPVSPLNAVTPTVAIAAGTFGRAQWHPTLGIFTVHNGMNQDLYFYKV